MKVGCWREIIRINDTYQVEVESLISRNSLLELEDICPSSPSLVDAFRCLQVLSYLIKIELWNGWIVPVGCTIAWKLLSLIRYTVWFNYIYLIPFILNKLCKFLLFKMFNSSKVCLLKNKNLHIFEIMTSHHALPVMRISYVLKFQ